MSETKCFQAKKNVYFNYEFDELDLDAPYPDEFSKFPYGLLLKHIIEHQGGEYYIYYNESLSGCELQKMKDDWAQFCPE